MPQLRKLHINMLELMAVFLALKHFLPFLEGFHVLVRTDNTTVVVYISRQGGTRSLQLHNLECKLIVWSTAHFGLLRATHIPVLNVGADLLSRSNPLYRECVLHPQLVNQILEMYFRVLRRQNQNVLCISLSGMKMHRWVWMRWHTCD